MSLYIVQVRKSSTSLLIGYLYRGKVTTKRDVATCYDSPSSAERAGGIYMLTATGTYITIVLYRKYRKGKPK